ncbi:MAG: hypothetical protein A2289_21445 [Deltaproteobacteria bacterium RIFOXYA12_FULL_58_15]|nr:MAG: hypothetical protein A2289_21445 [Deltaproteobacteria bacterium RIFOXYA12_FULL_58_15]OGR11892.1 MAG: hypothetical protein A2341_17135 [Deltaproteobacteria bacterium RIFOXYB12_FULL_58_9]
MTKRWDVIIIGAGPSGCLVSEILNAAGLDVLLVDAGPRLGIDETAGEPDRRQWPFAVEGSELGNSFDWYRVRAVGGRTHLWGGWCHRIPATALARADWPASARKLGPAYAQIEKKLDVREGLLDERYAKLARDAGLSIVPKRAAMDSPCRAWTPLRWRAARRARSYCVALRFEHARSQALSLCCFDLKREQTMTLQARTFVLAASPIESARVLLASELRGTTARNIGRNFTDHMVASYVLVETLPPPSMGSRGPLSGAALVENFVNLNSKSRRPYPGGFSIELNGPCSLDAFDLERMAPASERAGMRATQIHAIGECYPYQDRYVELDPGRCDAAGQAIPRLHVAWSPEEKILAEDMKQACRNLADALAPKDSKLIKFHDPLTPGNGHEAGTIRMGNPSEPCTPHGQLRALRNVWIADASTWPSSGDRHPTLTVLALALRAARACAASLLKKDA